MPKYYHTQRKTNWNCDCFLLCKYIAICSIFSQGLYRIILGNDFFSCEIVSCGNYIDVVSIVAKSTRNWHVEIIHIAINKIHGIMSKLISLHTLYKNKIKSNIVLIKVQCDALVVILHLDCYTSLRFPISLERITSLP